MIDPLETEEACRKSREDSLNEDIEDIIAAYGIRSFVSAVMSCSASPAIEKMGAGQQMKAITWILRDIIESKSPRFTAECMAYGAGMLSIDKETTRKIAKRYGMTHANVSHCVLKFCDRLQLDPTDRMKSRAARKEYALTNQPRRK
jgi:hypothetical protein